MAQSHQVLALLIDIEAELRSIGQWQKQAPPPEALRSEQPFAVDTLSFSQWLQFIFVPRMRSLIEHQQSLPGACNISPMAEEYYRDRDLPVANLMLALRQIDALLSRA